MASISENNITWEDVRHSKQSLVLRIKHKKIILLLCLILIFILIFLNQYSTQDNVATPINTLSKPFTQSKTQKRKYTNHKNITCTRLDSLNKSLTLQGKLRVGKGYLDQCPNLSF